MEAHLQTLLVVDDDRLFRLVLRVELEDAGYRVVEARTGEEALEALSAPFDLALFDYQLPDTTGLVLLKVLKRLRPGCPAIVLTATPEERVSAEVINNGAYRYLDKIEDSADILRAVQSALRSRRTNPA